MNLLYILTVLSIATASTITTSTPIKPIQTAVENCDENKPQYPCAGSIKIYVNKKPPQNGCQETIKIKAGFITAYACANCPADRYYDKDLDACPYFKCGDLPLCGYVEAMNKEKDLTPKQMKCLYKTQKSSCIN